MDRLEIPVPKGHVANSFEELVHLYENNFQDNAFVTAAHGFGGNGTVAVSNLEEILNSEKLKGKNEFIITELLDLESSLCAIGIVANEDEVMFVSVSDQLMDGVNYMGNVYPSNASDENVKKIRDYTIKIGQALGRKGYKGFVGIDFMTDKAGNLYFTEINPRKVGHIPEMTFAYNAANPNAVSLPELEFLAVTQGSFGTDISQYNMPQMHWGVSGVKAEKGQKTLNYIPRDPKEKVVFLESGITVLDHPGQDVIYHGDGKLARVVCVLNGNYNGNARQTIMKRLEEEKRKIRVA
jgi:hypothetical protein